MRTTGAYDPMNPETIYTHDPEPTSIYEVMYYRISNNPGVELPAAGGPGTTLFTILGIMLMAFAGTGMLVMKKRRRAA